MIWGRRMIRKERYRDCTFLLKRTWRGQGGVGIHVFAREREVGGGQLAVQGGGGGKSG